MDWTTIILTIVTVVLGGGNIIQLIMLRQLKRKGNAEAEQMEISALKSVIQANGDEIKRLHAQYEKLQRDYDELHEKYITMAEEMQELKANTKPKKKTTKTKTTK